MQVTLCLVICLPFRRPQCFRLAVQLSFLLLVQFALPMTCLPVNCNKQCNLLCKKHSMRKHTSS